MSIISTWDDVTSTVVRKLAELDFIGTRDGSVQPGKMELLNVGSFGNDMLQNEAYLKAHMHFGGDILTVNRLRFCEILYFYRVRAFA